jgi:hypothetical protein
MAAVGMVLEKRLHMAEMIDRRSTRSIMFSEAPDNFAGHLIFIKQDAEASPRNSKVPRRSMADTRHAPTDIR